LETSSTLGTFAERTTAELSTMGTRNVVLEETRGAIVGETLAKFDNGNQESGLGKRLANLAKGAELLCSGLDATKTVILVDTKANRVVGGVACLNGLLLASYNVGTDIVVVYRCAEKVRLVICLSLHVLQLLSAVVKVSGGTRDEIA
jgi:hypothetical protein